MKTILSGNEAVARGAWEGGLAFASAYPGTPSTEILENLAHYQDDLHSEWAPNEKVAVEAAIGASVAGVRSLAAMKHVGMNVAADPIFTFVYTGVTGGVVIVSADDPGMHSSQNEQDNRNYAEAARLLMLEPSDSQEAKDFTKLGLELSEQFNTPVLLHMTTRVCHSKSLVELGERTEKPIIPYVKNIHKYVATPANAKVMRVELEDRLREMEDYACRTKINRPEYNETKVGVVTSGIAYQYAREAFGERASYLKLGMTFPLPMDLIIDFADKVDTLYVVEEMDPYLERHLQQAGIDCIGKEVIPKYDELNTDIVREAVFEETADTLTSDKKAVMRPPTLCAGCPHRGFFYTLSKKKNVLITGDIGCYTLGSAPPLNALDTTFCMGGSLSTGHGASVALRRAGSDLRVVSVIGDSTFFHSGITSLMDAIYNGGSNVSVILDNRITGMTGHQENPGTGYTLMGRPAPEVDIPALCQAMGMPAEDIYTVNPNHLDEVDKALEEAMAKDVPTVIITKWPCVLKKMRQQDRDRFDLSPKKCAVKQDQCRNCKACVGCGCPAIHSTDAAVTIDSVSCTGCGVCAQICPFDAIEEVK